MLLKMVLNRNDNTKTLFWSDRQAETISRGELCYGAEINNILTNGVVMFMNDRISVYERPREYEGREDYDNTAHCIEIAHELDAIASGSMIRCPECGEIVSMPYAEGESIELDCGCKIDIDDLDDLDEVTIWDYLIDQALDIEYTIDSDLDYVSARIMIAFGGPNIYIDTATSRVELYWGSSEAHAYIDYKTRNMIDDYFEDEYKCRRECL